VPVSKIKVTDNKIWLVNYFMGKTIENIRQNPSVSLACWQGLEGYQIKGEVEYLTEGEIFSAMVEEAATEYPDRTVQGVLVLTAKELFDVSATADRPGEKII
jgi:predicted pyridoxine 5'-phosphate oxidase superfamily flavin-nucleotide-binding protein